MKNKGEKWIVLACVLLLVAACEKPPVNESTKSSSPVVSRIIPQQQPEKKSVPETASVTPELSSKILQKTQTGKLVQPDDRQAKSQTPGVSAIIENKNTVEKTEESGDVNVGYVPKSRLDPFMPLIQERTQPVEPENQQPDKPLRMLTPLEKMELSQIKLVAVVIMDNQKIAMVEEATGKGYEVKIGTYMGKNQGQVIDITFDSIVVKEIVADYKGKQHERHQEIKIHKPDSGE